MRVKQEVTYRHANRAAVLHSYFSFPWAMLLGRLRKSLRLAVENLALPADAVLLDFGCATMQYRDLFDHNARYIGVDLPENTDAHLILNEDGTVPYADGGCDLVLSTQVLEHVSDPQRYLNEAFRLLRPGGSLLLSTHGIFMYHPDPVDYWRWTGAGLRRIVQEAGFEISRFEGIIGQAGAGVQMFGDAVFLRLPRFLQPLWILAITPLIALFDALHSPEGRSRDAIIFVLTATKPAGNRK